MNTNIPSPTTRVDRLFGVNTSVDSIGGSKVVGFPENLNGALTTGVTTIRSKSLLKAARSIGKLIDTHLSS